MRPLTFVLAVSITVSSPVHSQAPSPSVAAWRADLRRIVHLIDSLHPWPWRRIDSIEFHRDAVALGLRLPQLTAARRATSMMALVARLHDGHTTLFPANVAGFDRWFPIRVVRFPDAVVITAADSAHADLPGLTVQRIGGRPAIEVAESVARLSGADNSWGAHEKSGLLSNAAVLNTLGLTSPDGGLDVDLLGPAGAQAVHLRAQQTKWGDPAWMQRGEMFGPPDIPVVTAFQHLAPLDYRKSLPSLPLSLRNRIPIWFAWLPEDSVLYVQSNFVQDFNGTAFSAVVDSVFSTADERPVRRMILDIRYNSGGDGSKLMPFVHELIRRPRLDQPGHLVILEGGKTFSAAVLWLSLLREHTTAVTIGEPAGAARNHSGDAGTVTLAGTGMDLQISRLRHYGTRSDDTSRAELPDFPITTSSSDYFAGHDPALEFARTTPDLRSVPEIAVARGPQAALAESERRVARFGRIAGWIPFNQDAMNSAGYDLLHAGRVDDAVAIFRANTAAFPQSGNVWDSYGEALLASGDTVAAIAGYQRSIALDPGNDMARAIVQRLNGKAPSKR